MASEQTASSTNIALALLVAGAFFMENLDATIIAPAIPVMADSFGVNPADMNIGISAYMLALGVFIPISGWMAQKFGPKRIFSIAILLFTVSSLLCVMTESLWSFSVVRILQGIGGAMMVPVGRLVVLKTTAKEDLIKAIAILTWPGLIAPVLGPPLGGLLVDHANWRWIFYINIPLGLFAFLFSLKLFPNEFVKSDKRFDWLGFILLGVAIFSLLWTTELITQQHLQMHVVITFAVVGIVAFILAMMHLRRTAAPVLHFNSLNIKTFFVAAVGGSIFRASINAIPFLVPLMYQIGFGFNATEAGLMLIAVFLGNILIKPFTTAIMRQFGFKNVLIWNGLLNSLLLASYVTFTLNTPVIYMCIILFLNGVTRSIQFTAVNTIAFVDIDKEGMSDANTLFSTLFQIAMALGIALGAMALRIGEYVGGGESAVLPFRIAFLIVAIVSFVSILDALSLPKNAGQIATGRK